MKKFLDENFLLNSRAAEILYHDHAAKQPIIDYHCHLSPKDIADDRVFSSITAAWLEGDHYKWRAMRANGINEKFITGSSSDFDKFEQWAKTVPYTLRNPLYHWTHLELKRYFGVDTLLNPGSAKEIFEKTSGLLQSKEFSAQNLLAKMNVEVVCTTDDPIDSLEYHQKHKNNPKVRMIPAWRPDKAMQVDNPKTYNLYITKLEEVTGISIKKFDNLLEALKQRHDYFHSMGCRLSDHGLDRFYSDDFTNGDLAYCFLKVRKGKSLNAEEIAKFKSGMLYHFALMDFDKGWVQQFHVGAIRNNNSRMMLELGPDTGYDSISDPTSVFSMSKFLDRLNKEDKLTKTILYNLNAADNETYATMIANFQDGVIPGKIQWGAAWWFLDQKFGMERHIDVLSSHGLLSRFVGMLTDSRSFLSFPRHEYFRRILCNTLGKDMENGEIPADFDLVGKMVEDICYNNAKSYFTF
jgi:glucuronate isomerase